MEIKNREVTNQKYLPTGVSCRALAEDANRFAHLGICLGSKFRQCWISLSLALHQLEFLQARYHRHGWCAELDGPDVDARLQRFKRLQSQSQPPCD